MREETKYFGRKWWLYFMHAQLVTSLSPWHKNQSLTNYNNFSLQLQLPHCHIFTCLKFHYIYHLLTFLFLGVYVTVPSQQSLLVPKKIQTQETMTKGKIDLLKWPLQQTTETTWLIPSKLCYLALEQSSSSKQLQDKLELHLPGKQAIPRQPLSRLPPFFSKVTHEK